MCPQLCAVPLTFVPFLVVVFEDVRFRVCPVDARDVERSAVTHLAPRQSLLSPTKMLIAGYQVD